jgi:hypothetical protein
MRKVQFLALFWTLLIAVPLTALALSAAAYLTENLTDIATAISVWSMETTVGGRGWLMEFSERWPEVAGMIIGQLVIMIILIFAREVNQATEKD